MKELTIKVRFSDDNRAVATITSMKGFEGNGIMRSFELVGILDYLIKKVLAKIDVKKLV